MQALFSEHWHAVRGLKPRLRDGVEVLHRRLRGKPWVMLLDPVTHRFHRMTPAVWRVVSLLDGKRTLDDIWDAACSPEAADVAESASDDVISQHELVQLISSLYSSDLIQTQVSPDAGEVFERYRKQQKNKRKQSWMNPISIKVPLLYPDAWFNQRAALARWMFSAPVFLLWLAAVSPAFALAWQHWDALTENMSDRVLSASNVALLWLTYPVVKAIHEWAHGMAVKAWGGAVREMGLMFIIFTPIPYVDATSSYRFPSKWARAAVAAAGIAVELLIGAVAVYVWLLAEPGLVTAVAYNVILIAGVSTVLVNGNPLMRYDGYHILCDLLELPNLAQRATQYWTYLTDRYAFGALDARPPTAVEGERTILFLYGLVAPVYRLIVLLGLAWFVAAEYMFIGIVMALGSVWMIVVMPIWKGYKHLRDAPTLSRRRGTAKQRTLMALAVLFVGLCIVPAPFYSVQQGVVWLPDEAIVRARVDGEIRSVWVAPGQEVVTGLPVLEMRNVALESERDAMAAEVEEARLQLQKARLETRSRIEPWRKELDTRKTRLDDLQWRTSVLNVNAGSKGVWVPKLATELEGRFVKRGDVLGFVVSGPSVLVRAVVPQEDMDLVRSRVKGVEVRLAQAPRVSLPAHLGRQVSGGETTLVSQALGTSGGGSIAVDPSDGNGLRTLKRVFDMEIELDESSPRAVFGDRVHVRFDLGAAPLGWQWYLRLRQMFLSRLDV